MSYIFEAGDTTVWSPSLRVGSVYVAVADGLGAAMGTPTGLSRLADDYIVIDTAAFAAFVAALLAEPAAEHPVFALLTEGFLATSAVLLERAGRPVATDRLAHLTAAVAAKMPSG
jgi:hypothetical protein